MSDEFEAEETMSEKPIEDRVIDAPIGEGDRTPRPGASETRHAEPNGRDRLAGPSLASLNDVPLRITVEVGTSKMLVRDALQLNKGSIVSLDRLSGDPADVLVNGRLIARGEIITVDDCLAVRIVELLDRNEIRGER